MAVNRRPDASRGGRGGGARPGPKIALGGRRNHGQDITELVNFSLPPRQPPPPPRRADAHKKREHPNLQRQRYIHAQYRFMLRPDRDYTANFCDANLHFKWEDILQVIVPVGSALAGDATSLQPDCGTCPICMSEPVAPRMSSCGHVYCYPCILRYLETGERNEWRKCPICQNTIHGKDFKAVRWFDAGLAHAEAQLWAPEPVPRFGDKPVVTMRLVERPNITTLALPRSSTWPSDVVPPNSAPWHFTPDVEAFARFMLATPEYMRDQYSRDIAQIEVEQRESNQLIGGSEADMLAANVFIVSARRKVEEQIRLLDAFRTTAVTAARKKAEKGFVSLAKMPELGTSLASSGSGSGSEDNEAAPYMAAMRGEPLSTAPPAPMSQPRQRRNVNPPPPETTNSLFYQAASGQPIFLHPLETNILLTHFKSDQLPLVIHVPVEYLESSTMQPEIRKRYKNLTHLPDACDLTLVQSDVAHLVPSAAFEPFRKALRDRKSRQRDKSRKEDRALQAAARRFTEASAPPPPPSFDTYIRTTDDGLDAFAPLPSTSKAGTSPTSVGEGLDDRTIWGTRAVATALVASGNAGNRVAIDDDDDDVAADLRAQQDAAWRALEEEAAQRRAGGGAAGGTGGGKKGKRNKGMVLSFGGSVGTMGRR